MVYALHMSNGEWNNSNVYEVRMNVLRPSMFLGSLKLKRLNHLALTRRPAYSVDLNIPPFRRRREEKGLPVQGSVWGEYSNPLTFHQ